jgi:hypothetical protein
MIERQKKSSKKNPGNAKESLPLRGPNLSEKVLQFGNKCKTIRTGGFRCLFNALQRAELLPVHLILLLLLLLLLPPPPNVINIRQF